MSKPYAVTKSGNSFSVSMNDGKELRCDPVGYGVWLANVENGSLTKVGNAYNLALGNVSYECIPMGYGTWLVIGGEEETPPPPPPSGFKWPFPRELHTSYDGHSGVDWPGSAVGNSAPIRSIGPGVVDGIWDTNYNTTGNGNGTGEPQWRGRCVRVNHGNIDDKTIYSLYAHMSEISVSDGQTVTGGQQLGVIGNTGYSFGTHLHFEININGARRPTDSVPSGYTVSMAWMDAHATGSW